MESTLNFRALSVSFNRFFTCCLAAAAILAVTPAWSAPRAHVSETLVPKGSVNQGQCSPDENVTFDLTLPVRNQAALDKLIQRQYNPADPMFHQFLTPEEYNQQFAPTSAQYAELVAFAKANGLTVTKTFTNHQLLGVSGTAAQAQGLFGVNMLHYVDGSGHHFHAPDRGSSVPAGLAALGSTVIGLNSAPIAKPHVTVLPQTVAPAGSTGISGSGYAPADIKNAYNLTKSKLDGTGQTLALFELDDYNPTNIAAYQSAYSTGTNTPTRIVVDGGAPLGGGQIEVELDIEMMMAIAPGAKINVYEAPNTGQGVVDEYNQIASDGTASSVSTSWGIWEGVADPTSETPAFTQMATEGISMFAASGDDGAYDQYLNAQGQAIDPGLLGVDDPASQPYVTGVGGTSVTMNAGATSRVSESVWGNPNQPNHSSRGSGGGGGISTVWSIPSYQSPVPTGGKSGTQYSTSQRNVPDVSLNADPATGYSIYTTYQGISGWLTVGGTSAAAPLWAAFTGLVNSDLADNHVLHNAVPATVGFANAAIYPLGLNATTYARDFYDITVGNNLFFNATTGFDDGSGWGAFNGSNLIGDLTAASGGPSSYPAITSFNPTSLPISGSNANLVITGTGFKAQAQAYWQTTALSTTVNSTTQLTVTVPSSLLQSLGNFPITVQNRDGLISPAVQYSVSNASPTITSLNPTSAAVGSGGFSLTINGTNFASGAVASWNGSPLSTSFLTSSLVTATVPTGNLVTAGLFPIVVKNLDNSQTSPVNFEVDAPAPTLTSISPTTVASGGATFTLTANGSNFSANSAVTWNGTSLTTTFVNSGQLTASVPSSFIATGGSVSIVVVTPIPGGGSSLAKPLTVTFAPPTITTLSPSFTQSGTTGFTLTVNGTGFRSGAVVSFNGSNVSTTFVSAVKLTASIPDASLVSIGSVPVIVTNTDTQASAPVSFFVTAPPPSISLLSPSSATIGDPPVSLSVTGANIQPSAVVKFGGVALSTVSVNPGGTVIVATIPTNLLTPAGNVSVNVVNGDQGTSGNLQFTVNNPVPTVTSVSPNSGGLNAPSATIVVTGTSFVAGSIVRWNATNLQTSFISSTSVSAIVPGSLLTAAGTATITVFNPTPGGGVSPSGVTFTVNNPVPTLSSASPSVATINSPTMTVTLNGGGFAAGMTTMWNGVTPLVTQFVNTGQATITLPAAQLTSVGTFTIAVTNVAPGGGTSSTINFNVTLPPPVITTVTPSLVLAGGADLPISVSGQHFQPAVGPVAGSVITFGSTALATTVVSDTQLTATVPAALIATAGLPALYVTNPDGRTSDTRTFPVTNPAPTVTSISPTAAIVHSSVTLTVNGTNFVDSSTILLNGLPVITKFLTSTQIQAVVPSQDVASIGDISVKVSNPQPGGGTSSPALTLSVQNAGAIVTSVTPSSGLIGGPDLQLTVIGSGFVSGAQVYFNSNAITTTFVSSTVLTATLPSTLLNNAPEFSSITVTNPNSPASFGSVQFHVLNPAPTTSKITPNHVPAGSGAFQMIITGKNFLASTTATINGTPLTITAFTATSLTTSVTAAEDAIAGTFPVVVSTPTPGGGSSSPLVLAVTNPVPVLTSLNIGTAPVGSPPLDIILTGSNFVTGALARWNGSPLTSTLISPTQLKATIPQADFTSAGSVGISVTNPSPGGGSSANSIPFTVTNPAPTISSLDPASVVAGTGSFNLTVNGGGFVSGAVVMWGSTALTTSFSSSQKLVALAPGSLIATGGTASITVRNLDGQTSGAATLTIVQAAPAPTLTSVTPLSITAGSADFSITIVGTGFIGSTTVTWNTTPLSITSSTATQIVATVPHSLVAQPGMATIAITTPAPGGGTVAASFTITHPAPSVTHLSPSSIAAGSAAFTLTVTGANFVPGSSIQFNNVQLSTTVVSATQLTATVPASLVTTQGGYAVVVTNPLPDGGSSVPLTFTVQAAIIHTFSPGLQMIGVPGDFSQVPLNQALDLPNPVLAAWYAAAGAYEVTPNFPADVFHRGQGYWVRFTQTVHVFDVGQPVTGETFFSLSLQPGWNLVSCPYSSPVSIPSMSVANSNNVVSTFGNATAQGLIGSPFYSYDQGTNAYVTHSTDSIQPYAGYWLYASAHCTLRIPAPGAASNASQ